MSSNRTLTCVLCPNGCQIDAQYEESRILSIQGGLCFKGVDFVRQEITDPRRNFATSVRVEGGVLPLVSVRMTAPVPRPMILAIMAEIKKVTVKAPVVPGQVIIENVLGLAIDVIATRHVAAKNDRSSIDR
jgi:CxxC motif-containing protein